MWNSSASKTNCLRNQPAHFCSRIKRFDSLADVAENLRTSVRIPWIKATSATKGLVDFGHIGARLDRYDRRVFDMSSN